MLRELEQHCRRPTMPPEIIKRMAFGFSDFENYRIRALLYRQAELGPRN